MAYDHISIENMNVSRTHLKGDGGLAWRVHPGFDQQDLSCNTCGIALIEYGIGKAWEVSRFLLLQGMVDPRVLSLSKDSGYLNVRPNLSALITLTESFRLNAEIGKRYYYVKGRSPDNIFSVEGRIGASRRYDLRFSYSEYVDKRYGVGLELFW